ncbi:DUF6443 domain-containing protein [Pedobacter helvus]|uniref:DUF6443 domain-containing protein n=1 Tax=Pedobacter helvus TaxID=2563444 RepID=A0ABW9JQ08_9SPHI|nr:DUF6443 domain-containing protein [Pedobacter ureilyticus]
MEKRIIILFFALTILFIANVRSQTLVQQNYIKTSVFKVAGKRTASDVLLSSENDKTVTIEYQDGFARPIQIVDVKASPAGYDMVKPISYDSYGRISKEYLPYTSAGQNGSFRENALAEQSAFYSIAGNKIATTTKPFSESKFDDSPMQQLLEQGSPGEDWQLGNGHALKKEVSTNTLNDHIKIFDIVGPSGEYLPSTLSKSKITDENGQESYVFQDKYGNVVLRRMRLDATISENNVTSFVTYLDTYYVYDEYGQLVYQIPPKATEKLIANPSVWGATFIGDQLFSYYYDRLGRLIKKKTPGIAPVYTCYDQFNRPVFIQDGKLRAENKWYFNKYDQKDRVVLTGIYQYQELGGIGATDHEKLQNYLDNLNYTNSPKLYYEERLSSSIHGYTNQAFPNANIQYHIVNYYDDYDFDNDGIADYSYTFQGLPGEQNNTQGSGFGLATGCKRLILGTSDWLIHIAFFDAQGRLIQTRKNNHRSLTMDNLSTSVYNFSNQLKVNKVFHNAGLGLQTTVVNKFNYDHVGRLISTFQNNNTSSDQQIAKYEYNELGQLIDKKLHALADGTFLQSIDYRYNIRGWLTHINNSTLTADGVNNDDMNDLFGMEFIYNEPESGLIDNLVTPLNWNGNLTAVKWKVQPSAVSSQNSNSVLERSYLFKYDKLNQLLDATYQANSGSTWSSEKNGYNESATYDHLGNILTLQRNELSSGASIPTVIDDLNYNYNESGSQLLKVTDLSGNQSGFKDMVNGLIEYGYDQNGNTVRDDNKAIGSISYNELNKMEEILFSDGRRIVFKYASDGSKLSKSVYHSGQTVPFKTLDYVDGFIYENNALSFFGMPEGRVRATGSSLAYEYFIKDHQGNVRVSFEAHTANGITSARLTQENHYYPFGLSIKGAAIKTILPTAANKYLYNNGSELNDDFSDDPNIYSTFFREYDPAIGRMLSVDPLADKFSSWSQYNYSMNSPSNLNDPTGAAPYNWRIPYEGYEDWFKGYDDFWKDPWENSEGTYGNSFEELINNKYNGDMQAMINSFVNSTATGTDMHYVPEGDSFASARIYGASGSEYGMLYYTVGAFYERDSQGNSILVNGKSGEFTTVMINQGVQVNTYSTSTSQANSGGDWMSGFSKWNTGVGFGFTALSNTPGSFRLSTAARGISPKYYGNGWTGNQYAKTFNVGKIGKGLGFAGAAAAVLIDIKGVVNYYDNPNAPNTVSPGKFSLNAGMSVFGFTGVGTIPAALYFGVDAYYPGGINGYIKDDVRNTIRLNNLCNCDHTTAFY